MPRKSLKTNNPCWKGYKPVGTKKKGGKTVPNCVPKKKTWQKVRKNLHLRNTQTEPPTKTLKVKPVSAYHIPELNAAMLIVLEVQAKRKPRKLKCAVKRGGVEVKSQ